MVQGERPFEKQRAHGTLKRWEGAVDGWVDEEMNEGGAACQGGGAWSGAERWASAVVGVASYGIA